MCPQKKFHLDERNACRNCLLPRPMAKLNENRLCESCVDYKPAVLKGIPALEEEFQAFRGKRKYDCVVAVSGGRDSMYALFFAKKVLKLNILAYNFNNEFVHDQAITNMKSACDRLGVDFVSVVSRRNICHKILNDQVRYASRFGPGELEMHLCGPCNVGAFLNAKRIAQEHGVPAIILGNSAEEKLPFSLCDPIPLKRKLLHPTAPYYFRAQLWKFLGRLEFSNSIVDLINLKFKPDNVDYESQQIEHVKILSLFDYIKWDRREIVSTIEDHLGWKKPEDAVSSWRFDCHLIGLVNYLWVKAVGYPKVFFGYNAMLRSGTMSREEALEQLESADWGEFTPQMEDVLRNDLNIPKKHIERIKAY